MHFGTRTVPREATGGQATADIGGELVEERGLVEG